MIQTYHHFPSTFPSVSQNSVQIETNLLEDSDCPSANICAFFSGMASQTLCTILFPYRPTVTSHLRSPALARLHQHPRAIPLIQLKLIMVCCRHDQCWSHRLTGFQLWWVASWTICNFMPVLPAPKTYEMQALIFHILWLVKKLNPRNKELTQIHFNTYECAFSPCRL